MEKESEDEILSKRNFQKSSGINLDNFIIQSAFEDEVAEESETVPEEKVDEAVGEVAEIFSRGDLPSNINRDGTVNEPPGNRQCNRICNRRGEATTLRINDRYDRCLVSNWNNRWYLSHI